MKYLLFVLLLVAVIITAGCTSGNQNTVVTPTQTTSPLSTNTLTTTAQTTAVYTPSQTYKTADLVLVLNTNPTYGFKMDYPSEWTYKREINKGWRAGYNFSSPDEKSYVSVNIDDNAGSADYWYPLITPTENSAWSMTDKGSWAGNTIKAETEPSYCLDGAGNPGKPGDCSSSASEKSYLHRRLISSEPVTLSGNVKAYKMVFAPDIKDRQTSEGTKTDYIMHVGKIQGYNFTVPQHPEVAVKVDGPVWDYGMDGQAYAIQLKSSKDQMNATSDIFDHMIKSFEVTIK
ncbi:MAG: hypothetical protein Q7V05_11470 [Methanoregula sp.]|nr:hypothetical protein [Methanoregula sp.]